MVDVSFYINVYMYSYVYIYIYRYICEFQEQPCLHVCVSSIPFDCVLSWVQMLQTETSAICNTWWLKATFQEPGENAAASAIGGAWNVGTRWFIGDRD